MIPQIIEPISPTKSLSDLVRSIGTPDVSLASTSVSGGSTSRRHSSAIEELSYHFDNMTMPLDQLESGETSGFRGRHSRYKPEKNSGCKKIEDIKNSASPHNKKTSAASIYPLPSGTARDAFGKFIFNLSFNVHN